MQWKKLGIIWVPDGNLWWAKKYATCPTPLFLEDGNLRLYLQCRDEHNIGRVGYVDVDSKNPLNVLRASKYPVLDVGTPGSFDDNGVFQTSVVKREDGKIYMYYVGFELCHHIRYRLLTGLAVSADKGQTFQKIKKTPILERSDTEMHFRSGSFVMLDDGIFKMWYVAGSEWININEKNMPIYDLRYQESEDGIHWVDTGKLSMAITEEDEHGFGRPWVIKRAPNDYQLFYSIRRKRYANYRLGYAESTDGINWIRKDEKLGLDISPGKFDSDAIMYSAIISVGAKTYCFYNGNNFGEHGFGVAELIE